MARSLREMAARRRLGAKALLGALGQDGADVTGLIADPSAHPHWEMTLDGAVTVCFDVQEPCFEFDQLVHLVASGEQVTMTSVTDGPMDKTISLRFACGPRTLNVVIESYCLP